jgi:hypothetical protein
LQRSFRKHKKVKTESIFLGLVEAPVLAGMVVAWKAVMPEPKRARIDWAKDDTDARRRKMGTGYTLEEEAWQLRAKDYRAMRPREQTIRDAWVRKMNNMSDEEWARHRAWMKLQLHTERASAKPEVKESKEKSAYSRGKGGAKATWDTHTAFRGAFKADFSARLDGLADEQDQPSGQSPGDGEAKGS